MFCIHFSLENKGKEITGDTIPLKGQCHEIFKLYFFSLIEPIWVPDKQVKMVFLKNSFSRRYSILKGQCHEIFELYFFSLIKPIWAPDKQAKMVFS